MKKGIQLAMLLDDNLATNFIHKKFMMEAGCVQQVIDFQSARDALDYLAMADNPIPELIFVDINMPIMDAWEFLEKFEGIDGNLGARTKIILLSTSLSPKDQERASTLTVIEEILIKPLSIKTIQKLVEKHY